MSANLAQWWDDARAWLRERGFEIWVITGIWAIVSVVIYGLAIGHESPRRYQDEFLFWGVAKSFAAGDGLTWRGVDMALRSWLYPVLISPVFWVANTVPAQYTGVHLVNSLMISATIFPGYLMARLYLCRWKSLAVALLVVSVPAMNYAGVIGTENLGYPLFTAACGAMLLALARPRPRNTLLAVGMMLAAILTRTQFVVLPAIFAGTLLMTTLMTTHSRRAAYLRERRSVWVALAALFALAGLVLLVQGRASVGLYAGAFDGVPLTTDALVFWIKAFAADVYLLTGIVPVIATLAIFGRAENRRDPLVGALIALAVVASVVFVLQISWFSATNPYDWRTRHIFYERYMFYLAPIWFVGLLVAFKRVSWPAALVSTSLATLIVSGFQTDAVLVPFSYDSFGLTLIARHMSLHPEFGPKIGMELARLTLLLGIVYIASTAPQRIVRNALHALLVFFTFTALIATQAQTWHYARQFSRQAFDLVPKPATFIDRQIKRPVAMIVTSTDDPLSYFTTEFWNARVARAFATDAAPISSPVMYSPKCSFEWARDGRIGGKDCDPVPTAWYLRSDSVTMHLKDEYLRVHPSPSWPTMTLMAGRAPARLLSLSDGRKVRSGTVQGSMTMRTFLDRPGRLRLRVAADAGVVAAARGRSVFVPGGRSRTLTVELPANEARTTLTIKSTGGLPTTARVIDAEVREPGGRWRSIL